MFFSFSGKRILKIGWDLTKLPPWVMAPFYVDTVYNMLPFGLIKNVDCWMMMVVMMMMMMMMMVILRHWRWLSARTHDAAYSYRNVPEDVSAVLLQSSRCRRYNGKFNVTKFQLTTKLELALTLHLTCSTELQRMLYTITELQATAASDISLSCVIFAIF